MLGDAREWGWMLARDLSLLAAWNNFLNARVELLRWKFQEDNSHNKMNCLCQNPR